MDTGPKGEQDGEPSDTRRVCREQEPPVLKCPRCIWQQTIEMKPGLNEQGRLRIRSTSQDPRLRARPAYCRSPTVCLALHTSLYDDMLLPSLVPAASTSQPTGQETLSKVQKHFIQWLQPLTKDTHLMLSGAGSFKTLPSSLAQVVTFWNNVCWPQEQDHLKPGSTLRSHTEGEVRISRTSGMPDRPQTHVPGAQSHPSVLSFPLYGDHTRASTGPLSPTFLRPPLFPLYLFSFCLNQLPQQTGCNPKCTQRLHRAWKFMKRHEVDETIEHGGVCTLQSAQLLLGSSQSHIASRKQGPSIARYFYFSREVGRPAFYGTSPDVQLLATK